MAPPTIEGYHKKSVIRTREAGLLCNTTMLTPPILNCEKSLLVKPPSEQHFCYFSPNSLRTMKFNTLQDTGIKTWTSLRGAIILPTTGIMLNEPQTLLL